MRREPLGLGAWQRVACACALAVFSSRPAHAADLVWTAPPACPAREAVVAEVERLVGRPLTGADVADFEAGITRSPDGRFDLVLVQVDRTTGERRSRTIHGRTCAEVSEGAEVAMALAIQSAESPPPTGEDAPPEEPKDAPRAATETPAPDTPPDERTGPRLRPAVGAFFSGDLGSLPSPAPGATVLASLGTGRASVSVFGSWFAAVDAPEAAGSFGLLVTGALACLHRDDPLFGLVCAGAEVGSMTAQGGRVRNPRAGSALWLALRAEIGFEAPLGSGFSFSFRVGAALPLRRPSFTLGGTEVVHRPGPVSGRAAIGAVLEF